MSDDGRQSHESKENRRPPSPCTDDVILPGRFSVDECALYRASSSSSKRNSCSFLYDDDSDSDLSFASSTLGSRHKPGIEVPSKYLHDLRERQSKGNLRSQHRANSIENMMKKRTNTAASYGSSMSQWALSPGRSLETPSSILKPPRAKLFNLGFDFFRSKKKSSPFSSPLKPKTCDAEAAHQLKLLNIRLVQWRFVNARASAANHNVDPRVKKQVLCAWDTLTKLRHLVLQERIELQKQNLELKLDHVLLSQVKHLEAWENMERQHSSSLCMTRQALHSLLSRLPLREGAKVNIESAGTSLEKVQGVTDAIISTVNSLSPMMESIVPLASQLAEVVAQEKLMVEQCHDLLRMMSELEVQRLCEMNISILILLYMFCDHGSCKQMQERGLKCCFLIQHKQTLDTKLD